MSKGKYCTGAEDYALASRIAVNAGCEEGAELGSMDECEWRADGVNDECHGCGRLIRKGRPVFWEPGGGESPDDGSYYGSAACFASAWMATPGSWPFFMECMGWELEPINPNSRAKRNWGWIWTLRGPSASCFGRGRVIARGDEREKQGPGPTFRRDLALARRLAKVFRSERRPAEPGRGE